MPKLKKNTLICDEQSSRDNLPEGWAEIELADHIYIAGRIGWRGLKAEEYIASGPLLISVPNLNYGDHVDFSRVNHISTDRYEESPEIQLRVGDTLLVKDGAGIGKLGYVAPLPAKATVNSSLLLVRPNDALVSPPYLFQYLKGPQFQAIARERITGSATPHLFQRDVKQLRVLVPPPPEQARIVAKVEELQEHINASCERLAKVPKVLKAFRQSVLAAACSGRLTEDWRDEHPKVEPGGVLLGRIRQKRHRLAQSTKERSQINNAFQPAFLVVGDELEIEHLPETWSSCRIGTIGTVVNGSTPSRKRPEFWGGSVPWVSSGEVRNNLIDHTRERITESGFESCSVRLLPPGTVLLAMIGEGKTRGQSSILCISATINQNIAAILLNHGLVSPEFIWRWFQFQYEATREHGGGTGPQALNCQRVRELSFVLPPLEEQYEIVRRIEMLFELADRIERRVERATKRADRLTQAVLAKAFRGELVPIEAELARRKGREYEPASVLLNRIKAQRNAAALTNGRRQPPGRPRPLS